MSFKNTLVGAGLILLVFALVTCGGGSGGGSGDTDLGISGTGFGFTGLSGNLTGAGTSGQYPILDGVNIPIQIQFTEEIDPASVNTNSIDIRTINVPESEDPDNLVQTSGGIQANVMFQVYGATLVLFPVLSFSDGDPVFGFRQHAAYEIKFQTPPSVNVVKSVSGKSISVPTGQPFVFITTGKVYDRFEGTPDPMFYYYDPSLGSEDSPASWVHLAEGSIQDIPVQPLPKFRVFFDEPVLKLWSESMFLVNSSDHTSDAMQVQFYPEPHVVIPVPGLWYIVQTTDIRPEMEGMNWRSDWLWENPNDDPLKVGMSYVIFEPNATMQALPTDINVELITKGLVADLAENVKGENIKDVRQLHTTGFATVDDIIEDFSTLANEDDSASSATWGEVHNDETYLTWGGGGGTGVLGLFYPPESIPEANHLGMGNDYDESKPLVPDVVVDDVNKVIDFPTCSYIVHAGPPEYKEWTHFVYNFTSFQLPFGWTVRAAELEFGPDDVLPERLDLKIYVSGKALIEGTISVDGGVGESRIVNYDDTGDVNINGTAGGVSYAGGAPGGSGGSIPSGSATNTVELNQDKYLTNGLHNNGEKFDVPGQGDLAEFFNGVTGITDGVHDGYIIEGDVNPDDGKIEPEDIVVMDLIDALGDDILDQMLQPNVGMGLNGKTVMTNRPTFYIKEIVSGGDGTTTKWVEIHTYTDPTHPKYKGLFTDDSNDPKDIFGQRPPIAKKGDTYLIGYLQGSSGESSSLITCGGQGGEPLTVAQGSATYASAGGGGGGGGRNIGNAGETGFSGPGYPPQGGNSAPETIGGDQSSNNLVNGTVELVNNTDDKIVIKFEPEEIAKMPLGFDPADLANYRINPNTNVKLDKESNDWFFQIKESTWFDEPGGEIEFTVYRINQADMDPAYSYDLEHEEVGAVYGANAMLVAPEIVGGSGGGGSGIELTDTLKVFYIPSYVDSSLPYWKHGAGGGSGGGAISLESAKSIEITASGKISANGGVGGELYGFLGNIPSGGGGSGGSIVLRARNSIQVQFGGTISAEGGTAKVSLGAEDAGKGGEGFIRLESADNDLSADNFSHARTVPPVMDIDLGKFVSSDEESLGISNFYSAGVIFINHNGELNYQYSDLVVTYLLDVWDPDSSEYVETEFSTLGDKPLYDIPPFEIALNSADMIPETGFLDISTITDDFTEFDVDDLDFFSKPENEGLNKPYIRFKIVLRDKEPGKDLYNPDNLSLYLNPRIKEFKLSVSSVE